MAAAMPSREKEMHFDVQSSSTDDLPPFKIRDSFCQRLVLFAELF
jgi:hypothetical protein